MPVIAMQIEKSMGDELHMEHRFDSRTRVVLRESAIQREHLESVSHRIGAAVMEFFSALDGQQFSSTALHEWVEAKVGRIAPGSADRIMRLLRAEGKISYRVVNRAQSLYRAGV